MTDETDPVVARPVVDAAKGESRNQRIVAGVLGVLILVPKLTDAFGWYTFTPEQLASGTEVLVAISALLLLFIADQTRSNALYVETQVTSTFDPVKTSVADV